MAIPVMEFQVWRYKISQIFAQKGLCSKETLVFYKMEWWWFLRKGEILIFKIWFWDILATNQIKSKVFIYIRFEKVYFYKNRPKFDRLSIIPNQKKSFEFCIPELEKHHNLYCHTQAMHNFCIKENWKTDKNLNFKVTWNLIFFYTWSGITYLVL